MYKNNFTKKYVMDKINNSHSIMSIFLIIAIQRNYTAKHFYSLKKLKITYKLDI